MSGAGRTQKGMTHTPAHKPAGTPDGGQFTTTAHSDAVPTLTAPANPFKDADGTVWASGGDEYQDTYLSHVNGIEAKVTTDIREEGARATVVDYRGTRPLEIGAQTLYESLDEAKAAAKGIRERAARYGHNHISEGSRSPWGRLQGHDPMAPGIDMTWTSGHGGILLSPERADEIDPAWREDTSWYEQDCAWTKAVITHHKDLPARTVADAHKLARKYYPAEYNAVVGKDPGKYGVETFEPATV